VQDREYDELHKKTVLGAWVRHPPTMPATHQSIVNGIAGASRLPLGICGKFLTIGNLRPYSGYVVKFPPEPEGACASHGR
jgi:hypothetical protein